MARRGGHRGRPGGGEVVQASRPNPARLTAAVAAVVVEGALAAFPLLRSGSLNGVVVATGALALVLMLFALVGFVDLVPWSVALAAVGFVVVDAARSEPIVTAPVYGAGLLLVAELAYASRELARGREEHPSRRVARLAVVTAVALLAASLPALATGYSPPTGVAATLLALAAAALLLAPSLLLLRARH
jgi:hypothetical protein